MGNAQYLMRIIDVTQSSKSSAKTEAEIEAEGPNGTVRIALNPSPKGINELGGISIKGNIPTSKVGLHRVDATSYLPSSFGERLVEAMHRPSKSI